MLSLVLPAWGAGFLEASPSVRQDSAWIRRCQNGDRDAFEPLVRQNAERIRRLVWGLLGERREETDDVVQEVFLKAYLALPRFRQDARFSTWLYRIAVNHCRDHLRRAAPLPLELDESRLAGIEEPSKETVSQAREDEQQKRSSDELHSLLSKLPEKHRRILVMRELEELSYDEIGNVLEIRPGTVRSRLNRARAGLLRLAERERKNP